VKMPILILKSTTYATNLIASAVPCTAPALPYAMSEVVPENWTGC
jgi:hypothetical protein